MWPFARLGHPGGFASGNPRPSPSPNPVHPAKSCHPVIKSGSRFTVPICVNSRPFAVTPWRPSRTWRENGCLFVRFACFVVETRFQVAGCRFSDLVSQLHLEHWILSSLLTPLSRNRSPGYTPPPDSSPRPRSTRTPPRSANASRTPPHSRTSDPPLCCQ